MTSGVGQKMTLQLHRNSLDVPPRSHPKGPRRCLFGPTDPVANAVAADEAFEAQRRRMLDRFGFDVLTGKPVPPSVEGDSFLENKPPSEELAAAALSSSLKTPKKERRRSFGSAPYSNLRITDFWKTRKSDVQRKSAPGKTEKATQLPRVEPMSSV